MWVVPFKRRSMAMKCMNGYGLRPKSRSLPILRTGHMDIIINLFHMNACFTKHHPVCNHSSHLYMIMILRETAFHSLQCVVVHSITTQALHGQNARSSWSEGDARIAYCDLLQHMLRTYQNSLVHSRVSEHPNLCFSPSSSALATPSLHLMLRKTIGFPFIESFMSATQSLGGATGMTSIVVTLAFSSTIGSMATVSRMI